MKNQFLNCELTDIDQVQQEVRVAGTTNQDSGSAGGGSGEPRQRKIGKQEIETQCVEGNPV